ncbi:hypothetical protein ACA910_005873 [Epithemia clementina (nom. ined.)]
MSNEDTDGVHPSIGTSDNDKTTAAQAPSSVSDGDAAPAAAKSTGAATFVGGPTEEPAFCLLDGYVEDPTRGGTRVPFRLPINRLPANLGRTHVPTEDAKHFFGLGKTVKALSRLQCKIEYRTNQGSIEPLEDPSSAPGVKPKFVSFSKLQLSQQLHNPTKVDLSGDDIGFFVVTCLGKNPIKVNGQKVEQNESCVLIHGSAVKISAFSLYFMLPEPEPDSVARTLSIPLPGSGGSKKRSRTAMEKVDSSATTGANNTINSNNNIVPEKASSSGNVSLGDKNTNKKYNRGNAWTSIQEQLDSMTTEDLLQQLNAALEKGIWDRRCQFMGATVAYRAVREAALVPSIQQQATLESGGISKAEVVEWIHASERFKDWATIMQTKLEPKSYQSSISKAMARAGYERINNKNFGRHVRWYIPDGVNINDDRPATTNSSKKRKRDGQDEEEGDGNRDEDDDDDAANDDEDDGGGDDDEEKEDEDGDDDNDEDVKANGRKGKKEYDSKDDETGPDENDEEEDEEKGEIRAVASDDGNNGNKKDDVEDDEEDDDMKDDEDEEDVRTTGTREVDADHDEENDDEDDEDEENATDKTTNQNGEEEEEEEELEDDEDDDGSNPAAALPEENGEEDDDDVDDDDDDDEDDDMEETT